jgi:RNA polymerase sigma factor for flagellar operon FliA
MEYHENSSTDSSVLRDNAAREQLVLNHLSQIRHIAQGLSAKLPLHVDFDDLLGAGAVGLMDALEKFDASRDVKFRTYAELRIRGAMLDSLRDMDWASRSLRRKSRNLERASRDLEKSLGRPATQSEICQEANLTLEEYYSLLRQIQGLNLLGSEEFVANDRERSSRSRMENLSDDTMPDPFCAFHASEMRDFLAGAIDGLPKKESLVIRLYYLDELPMKEISSILGLTVSSVSFLHTRALARLRNKLRKVADRKVA